jgi:4-amino-4-deoxy-L-arabinose transferase-like glycosyltransferase
MTGVSEKGSRPAPESDSERIPRGPLRGIKLLYYQIIEDLPRGKRANIRCLFSTDRRFPAACGGELQSVRTLRILLGIVLAAVLIRLVFVLFFSGFTEQNLGDPLRYNRVAKFLLERHAFWEYVRRPTAFAPPLYPAFLAGVYGLFGYHAIAVKIIQALAGGLLPWAVFALARRRLGSRTALVAAAWTAVYPELIVMTGYLYTETFFMLAAVLSFGFLLAAFRDDRRRDWILAGLFLGLSVLVRNLLFFFPGFLFALCLPDRELRARWRRFVLLAAVTGVVILPWSIRNALVFREFIPVTTGAGTEFWIGSDISRGGRHRHGESAAAILALTRDAKTETEKDRILIADAVRNIRSRPLGYVKVCLGKAFRTFFQIYENVPTGRSRRMNLFLAAALGLFYYPLLALGAAGVWITRRQWRQWLPLTGLFAYAVLLYSAVHFVPRYRIPLIPFLIVFASIAAVRAADRLSRRSPS